MSKPWQNEPDYYYEIYKDHKIIILRNDNMKHLCGYVSPNKDQYKTHYDCAPAKFLNCHGGLTYSDTFDSEYVASRYEFNNEEEKLKLINFIGDSYWLGFDCGHGGDYFEFNMPDEFLPPAWNMINLLAKESVYRDLQYVINECRGIVDQIIENPIYKHYYNFDYDDEDNIKTWFYDNSNLLQNTICEGTYLATNSDDEFMVIKLYSM